MRTRYQILLGIGAVFLVILPLAGVSTFKISKAIAEHMNFAPPPDAVTTAIAEQQTWQDTLRAVGSVAAVQGAVLSAEENGRVEKVLVESGSDVTLGQVLIELDTSVEQADLKSAQAKLEQASKALVREQEMRTNKITSVEALEKAQANARDYSAQVEGLRARILRKKIVAPFAGRAGIRLVNVGQYVSSGMEIIPVYALDPIYVNFTVPQQEITRAILGQNVSVRSDSIPDVVFAGKLTAVDPQVDMNTRNVRLQATIPNADGKLRPGMFVQAEVGLGSSATVIAVPETSIAFAPYGDTVFVVETKKDAAGKETNTVRQQIVQLGARRGDFIAVLKGLNPGEQIVSSGVFKLRPGSNVAISKAVTLPTSETPDPEDS